MDLLQIHQGHTIVVKYLMVRTIVVKYSIYNKSTLNLSPPYPLKLRLITTKKCIYADC
jgi:hypothetical protein